MSTKGLKHTIYINNEKANCTIFIKLADECNNGHSDFTITAQFWEIGKIRTSLSEIKFGCCHEEILEVAPELQLFVDLHLCDFRGYPMYYIDNSYYYLRNNQKAWVEDHLKLKDGEYDLLRTASNINEFEHILIDTLANNLVWEDLGRRGVKLLESLTGNTFVPIATKLTHYRRGDDEKPKQTTPII
jgi:hypothetical protein